MAIVAITLQEFQSRLQTIGAEVGGIDLVAKSELIEDCFLDTLDHLYTVLVGKRGYAKDDVDDWVLKNKFHMEMALWEFFSQVLASRQENIPAFVLAMQERKKELETVLLLDEDYAIIQAVDEPEMDITSKPRQFTENTEW